MRILKTFLTILILCAVAYLFTTSTSCVYHKADIEYPCDTTIVKYSVEIKAIMDDNCQNCHGADPAQNAASGINLYDYGTISSYALDGSTDCPDGTLLADLTQTGCPFLNPMPKGQPKLNDCSINKFRAWINRGAPDN